MSNRRIFAVLLAILGPAGVLADTAPAAPPPPPEGVWFGKGQFGFLNTTGNSVAEAINTNIDMSRIDGPWKNEYYLAGLYGKSAGITSAQRIEGHWQTDYTISGDMFAFGALRYEHDLYDGFQYQASGAVGLGYHFINTDDTKLTGQIGVGYRRLRPEDITKASDGVVIARVLHDATGDVIGTAGLDFAQKLSANTTFTNKFLMETGKSNTLLHDELALTVKMSDKLALSIGYGITDNTKPPGTLKKLNTITTVNLVFGF